MPNKTRDRQFTTFEVAKICRVFHTTVINWVNKNKLKAHHTPGGHRRIQLDDLLEFMRRFEMPIPEDLVNRRKNILVVDDDPAVGRMLMSSLGVLPGVEVHSCAGGLEALINIGKEAPDLLVLDVRMPQVNGLEVCRVLKAGEHTRAIKIIAVSGELLTMEEEEAVVKHSDVFMRKPLSTQTLREEAARLLELDAAETEAKP